MNLSSSAILNQLADKIRIKSRAMWQWGSPERQLDMRDDTGPGLTEDIVEG